MRFRLLETYLIEDIQAVLNRYNVTDQELPIIMKLIESDPTYKNNNSVGKYGKWLIQQYQKGNFIFDFPNIDNEVQLLPENDSYRVRMVTDDDDEILEHTISGVLSNFERSKPEMESSDIGHYKTFRELWNKVLAVDSTPELSNKQVNRLANKSTKDQKLVYEDKDWQVWIPLTYYASVALGRGTNWCTATNSSSDYYDDYTESGPLYIIINKHDPTDKYQFHFESGSFMDKMDNAMPVDYMDTFDQNVILEHQLIGVIHYFIHSIDEKYVNAYIGRPHRIEEYEYLYKILYRYEE